MPKLKLTYTQIKEQAARDKRHKEQNSSQASSTPQNSSEARDNRLGGNR